MPQRLHNEQKTTKQTYTLAVKCLKSANCEVDQVKALNCRRRLEKKTLALSLK